MKYNTMFDVAFTVDHNENDPYNVSKEQIIAALLKRLADLVRMDDGEFAESIGVCDTYKNPVV